MLVHLTPSEIEAAQAESQRRIEHTRQMGFMDHTTRGSQSASDMGALGEMAVAKLTGYRAAGFEYSSGGKRKDVGPLQVRTTQRGVLYFKDFEDPMDVFVAVTASWLDTVISVFVIKGWRFGFECQKPEWRRTAKQRENMRPGQQCWWEVPHASLYELESLQAWCVGKGFPQWVMGLE